jgi:membrane protein YdbS with pleckstrin-like domain
VSSTATVIPRYVRQYLLPTEELRVAVRRHPAQLVEPVASVVGALAVVLWVDVRLPPDAGALLDILYLGWSFVVARAVWRFADWRRDWFVATDRRLLLVYGIVTHRVAMMPMKKVTDMTYNRSPLGQVLGYGQFVMESAGQDQALRAVDWVPNPDELYRSICRELFGSSSPPSRSPAGRTNGRRGEQEEQDRSYDAYDD